MDDQTGQADLQALFEMRRRVVAAFEDIATGVEAMASHIVIQSETLSGLGEAAPAGDAAEGSEIRSLREALEEERVANAQLEERVRLLHERAESHDEAAAREVAALREEIEAVRSERSSRDAELSAVLSELIPLLEEAV